MFRNPLTALLLAMTGMAAQAGVLETSVAIDGVYIPALSLTSAAQTSAPAADKAQAALQRLQSLWPALRASLSSDLAGGTSAQQAALRKALISVDADLLAAGKAVAARDFKGAHESLEGVRITLMDLRVSRGVDYFVDRLTAFHEPMEVLALAGNAPPTAGALTPAKRVELEKAFVHARVLWRGVEAKLPIGKVYVLDGGRLAQFEKGVADETAALSRLSDALRSADTTALLKAAAATKPPYARAFTAFGQGD